MKIVKTIHEVDKNSQRLLPFVEYYEPKPDIEATFGIHEGIHFSLLKRADYDYMKNPPHKTSDEPDFLEIAFTEPVHVWDVHGNGKELIDIALLKMRRKIYRTCYIKDDEIIDGEVAVKGMRERYETRTQETYRGHDRGSKEKRRNKKKS